MRWLYCVTFLQKSSHNFTPVMAFSAEKNLLGVTKQAPAMYRLKGNKYSHHYGAPSLGICLNAGVSGRPSG